MITDVLTSLKKEGLNSTPNSAIVIHMLGPIAERAAIRITTAGIESTMFASHESRLSSQLP